MKEAEEVYKAAVAECETTRQDALKKYTQYTNELEELKQIANPGDVESAGESTEAPGAPANVTVLMEERVSIKKAAGGQWSEQQCIAFLRFQSKQAPGGENA